MAASWVGKRRKIRDTSETQNQLDAVTKWLWGEEKAGGDPGVWLAGQFAEGEGTEMFESSGFDFLTLACK